APRLDRLLGLGDLPGELAIELGPRRVDLATELVARLLADDMCLLACRRQSRLIFGDRLVRISLGTLGRGQIAVDLVLAARDDAAGARDHDLRDDEIKDKEGYREPEQLRRPGVDVELRHVSSASS